MGVEQGGLSPEEAANFKAKGKEQLVTDNLVDYGRAENTNEMQYRAGKENARFDALEKAKSGSGEMTGLSKQEQDEVIEIAKSEGRDAATSAVESAQKDIAERGFKRGDVQEIAGDLAYNEFGPQGSKEKQQAESAIEEGMLGVLKEKQEMDQADMMKKRAESAEGTE